MGLSTIQTLLRKKEKKKLPISQLKPKWVKAVYVKYNKGGQFFYENSENMLITLLTHSTEVKIPKVIEGGRDCIVSFDEGVCVYQDEGDFVGFDIHPVSGNYAPVQTKKPSVKLRNMDGVRSTQVHCMSLYLYGLS